jgi:hypothetical protein
MVLDLDEERGGHAVLFACIRNICWFASEIEILGDVMCR